MTAKQKQAIIRAFVTSVASVAVFVVLLLHNAWGDERYELKHDAIRKEIRRIDTQLAIKDTEILFSESDREKEKLKAIKAVYERDKDALKAELDKS